MGYWGEGLNWDSDNNITNIVINGGNVKAAIAQGMLIDAFMGANEPNGYWPIDNIVTLLLFFIFFIFLSFFFQKLYNGQGWPNGAIDYIRDLYLTIRSDSTFGDVWVIGALLDLTRATRQLL